MWQLALAINLVLFVTSSLLRRRYAQSHTVPGSVTLAISYILGVMPISIVAGLIFPHNIEWSGWTLWLLLAASFLVAVFILLSFLAVRYIPAALNQTIFQVRILITITLGWMFLGEKLAPLQIFGGLFVLASGILAVWAPARAHRKGNNTHPHLVRGIILTLVSAAFLGVGVVIEKAALQYMDIGAFFIYGFGLQTLWLTLFAARDAYLHRPVHVTRTILRESVMLGVVVAGIGISYFVALSKANNISLIAALSAFVLPLTAIAAHYILKERDDSKLLWAAITLGVTGVLITVL